jgi:hypothetical protein
MLAHFLGSWSSDSQILGFRLPKFGDVRPPIFWESDLQNLQKVWELNPPKKKFFLLILTAPGSFGSQYSKTPWGFGVGTRQKKTGQERLHS